MAQFAINNSFNKTIGTTPFHLVYGRHPRIPLHATREMPGDDLDAVSFVEQMEKARQLAVHAIKRAQESQRRYANLSRRMVRYQPQDLVLLSTKHLHYGPGLAKKLLPRFVGPFTINYTIDKGDETVAANLHLPEGWKIHNTFHVSLLKPFTPAAHAPPPTPLNLEQSTTPYELDRILGHRGSGRTLELWCQWKGSSLLMWEPVKKLLPHYEMLVNQYLDSLPVLPALPSHHPRASPEAPRRSRRISSRQERLAARVFSGEGESVGLAPVSTAPHPRRVVRTVGSDVSDDDS